MNLNNLINNNILNDINNILEDYDLSNISFNFQNLDIIISSVIEILEQFHQNLDYNDIYNMVLENIESYNQTNDDNQGHNIITNNDENDSSSDDDNIDEELLTVNAQTYVELDSMRNELLKTVKEVDDTKLELLKQQFEHLLTVEQPEQRTPEWYEMRKGMCTASDICAILGKGKYNTRNDIILKKCGKGKPFKGNKFTMHGQIYEDVAIGIYESRHNYTKVHEFGLIPHPTISCLGASPDGITPDGIMIEIKCPPKRQITGIVPYEYICQMQIQLEVCNLQVCHFFECLIVEYSSKEEYSEDIFYKNNKTDLNIILETNDIPTNYITVLDERRSSNGLEKGVIGSVLDKAKGERKYIYPPMNLTIKNQEDFIDNSINKMMEENTNMYVYGDKYKYWKLEKSSEKYINRDNKWFTEALPKIKKFWQEVEERRTKGEHSCDDILKPIRKKTTKRVSKNLESGKLLIDDSSDEENDFILLNNNQSEKIMLNSQCLILSDNDE